MKFVSIRSQFEEDIYRELSRETEVTTGVSYATLMGIGKAFVMLLLAVGGLIVVGIAALGITIWVPVISLSIFGNTEVAASVSRTFMGIGYLLLLLWIIAFYYDAIKK